MNCPPYLATPFDFSERDKNPKPQFCHSRFRRNDKTGYCVCRSLFITHRPASHYLCGFSAMPCQEASEICLAAAHKKCRAGATRRTTYKRLQSGDAIRAWLRHRKRMTIMRRKAFHFSVYGLLPFCKRIVFSDEPRYDCFRISGFAMGCFLDPEP